MLIVSHTPSKFRQSIFVSLDKKGRCKDSELISLLRFYFSFLFEK